MLRSGKRLDLPFAPLASCSGPSHPSLKVTCPPIHLTQMTVLIHVHVALYACGLQQVAAEEVTRATPLTTSVKDPSQIIYMYLYNNDNSFWLVENSKSLVFSSAITSLQALIGAEFHDLLRSLKFRAEVTPGATYADYVLPHGDARNWVKSYASALYMNSTEFGAEKDYSRIVVSTRPSSQATQFQALLTRHCSARFEAVTTICKLRLSSCQMW